MSKLAGASMAVSLIVAGAAGWALHDLRALEPKVAALEVPADPKAIPEAAKPAAGDPRGVLASRIEALERRVEQTDETRGFHLAAFRRDAEETGLDIDAQTLEILAQLAAIRANPPVELTDAILEEKVRAGLLEKRKKDMKKLVKKEGQKQLKKADEKLKLSPEQMEKLKKFFEGLYDEWAGTLAQIFGGEEIPQEQLNAKVEDTKARVDVEMKSTLSPEQYDTWTREVAPSFFQDPFRGGIR
ncbi:MAG: hypothetical protein HUU15_10760 [Candidatus Brocadiae bacterium]|nr:hypothetical protein [Candidatus Brocadiia bacterium]